MNRKIISRRLWITAVLMMGTFLLLTLLTYAKSGQNRLPEPAENMDASSDEKLFEPEVESSSKQKDTVRPEDIKWDREDRSDLTEENSEKIRNILLIGQDRVKGSTRQRSDTMIICSVNYDTKRITLVSLMRDMYVPIPGYADNRINAAYVFGGMELLDKVIEQNFGVRIDANVEVDFDGFIEAMAQIGSIPVVLNAEEAEHLNRRNPTWTLQEGENLLEPDQVLAYVRNRTTGNADYDRTDRQRKVLTSAFSQLRSKDLRTLAGIALKVFPCLTTDMSSAELLKLSMGVMMNDMQLSSESYRIPAEGTYRAEVIRGMQVLVPDLSENAEYLRECLQPASE